MDSNNPTDRSTLPWEEEPAGGNQNDSTQPPPQDTASQPGQGQSGNPENREHPLAFSVGTMFIIAPQGGGGGADGNENENFINPFQPPVKRALKEAWDSFEEVSSEQLPDISCPICYDDMNINEETTATRMPCGHIFGKNCLKIWLDDHCSCPLCRKEVPHETIGSSHPPVLFIIPHSNHRPQNQGENAEQAPAENTNPFFSLAQQQRPEGAEPNATPANGANEGTPTPPRIALNRIRFVLAPHRTPQTTESASDSPSVSNSPALSTSQPQRENPIDSNSNAPSTEPAPPASSLPRPPITLTSLFNSFLSNPLDRNLPSMRTDAASDAERQNAPPAESQNSEVGAARPIEPSTLVQPPNILNFPPFIPPAGQPNTAQTPESGDASGRPSTQFITFHGLPSLADLPTVLESLFRPNGLLNLQNHARQAQNAEGEPSVGREGNVDQNMNEQEQAANTTEPSEEDRTRPEGATSTNPMIHIYFFRPPNADATVTAPTNTGETQTNNDGSNEDRSTTESGRDSLENNESRSRLSSALPSGLRHLSEMGQRIVRRFQEEFENRMRQTTEHPQQEQATNQAEAPQNQTSTSVAVPSASPSQPELPSANTASVIDEGVNVDRPSVSTPSEAVSSDIGETSRIPSGASTPRMVAPVARRNVRHHPYSRPTSTKPQCQLGDQGGCSPNDRFLHFECGHSVHQSCYHDSPENRQMDEVDEQCPKCRQQNEK
ncbi:sir antagonist [Schizosaccharomyces cryophilus OY26]|uniref:Sir antagonist n=1 Tax=Schizosaccharomyces cryophilus (strain OY26 / ATCC MYA-4695 / CBS 11777 / NBRC 106824 / NRRL Y48691) TaxID=653667 RepID=S9W5U6_SCHCR|nr:sir antagonist [Schizosaccharomyces cryophilus OY26]EPY53919.1 sir antagonist [Schizosaccharomyces cryophilus OY26]